ncbi:Asp-tRNA(Asn)/Glu-tRNA(Gln) amidotransferase subunit GatC [Bacillus mesophilum]|uniref:Aspartyl/glutamyl-tRNA(Asn/Gln) amidotransferase subunit C n=1 Tax=Bacillus mesophilum TaxID=1071718 RepID=A0A7V7RLB9_9BACI|nr:Asp-tRNA(Asn)/Glu-tRNA(Gln) amidotransferase subunit GatC [Bacillus mesophilum]KAB2331661.1 Asp-tRNA(Asn)/Glu-tRNA(Gln) amidotransferase subunit GatC [Bacillus mesophilum]
MTRISSDQVKHVANLARLQLSEEETESFRNQLEAMITFAEQLNELDTDGVEPTSHVLDMKNVMREDVAKPGLPQTEVVKNAPDHQDGYIKVPPIMTED